MSDSGKTIAGLMQQRPMVKKVINSAINGLHFALMSQNAFPDSGLTTIFIRDALMDAATRPGYESMLSRLKTKVTYVDTLQHIVSYSLLYITWSLLLRSVLCSQAGVFRAVDSYFMNARQSTLLLTTTSAQRQLMQTSIIFSSPSVTFTRLKMVYVSFLYTLLGTSNDGFYQKNKPYDHEIFVTIIKERFFTGSRSLGALFPTRFVTSFPELEPLAVGPEIPAPMLAIAATAVCCSVSSAL